MKRSQNVASREYENLKTVLSICRDYKIKWSSKKFVPKVDYIARSSYDPDFLLNIFTTK